MLALIAPASTGASHVRVQPAAPIDRYSSPQYDSSKEPLRSKAVSYFLPLPVLLPARLEVAVLVDLIRFKVTAGFQRDRVDCAGRMAWSGFALGAWGRSNDDSRDFLVPGD